MKLLVFHLGSLGLAISSTSNLMKRDPKSYSNTWGVPHTRESIDPPSPSEENTPFIVLPSTSNNNNNVYSLTDLPRNNNWGLVEVDRDFDLIADEFADKSDNFVYTQTDNPSEFIPSSHDPWKVVHTNPTEPSVVIDDRLFATNSENTFTNPQLDFTWNPSKSVGYSYNIDQGSKKSDESDGQQFIEYQEEPIPNVVIANNDLKAEHREVGISGPQVNTSSVKSGIEYAPTPVLGPQTLDGAISLPILDTNNVYVDPAIKKQPQSPNNLPLAYPPQPRPPSNLPPVYQPPRGLAPVYQPPPVYPHTQPIGFNYPPKQNPAPPSYSPQSQQFIKRPAHPPPRPEIIVPRQKPRLSQPLQTVQAVKPGPQLQHNPPVWPDKRVQNGQQVTKLSKNPLTRLKQQLNLPNPAGASLPSLNDIRENIKNVLPTFPTIPTAPPRQGYGNSGNTGFKIPTFLGTIVPGIISPGTRKPWLLHSLTDRLMSLISPPSAGVSTSQNSPAYAAVTEAPFPLSVPTYLPISKKSEFSEGFQILVQYIFAMVGIALILAI